MKPEYTPDNTRSSIVVVALLAAGVTVVALLIGLSEKPAVTAIGISPTTAEVAELTAAATLTNATTDSASGDAAAGESTTADGTASGETADDTLADPEIADDPGLGVPIDGSEDDPFASAGTDPTPTPEVAAAVVPTVIEGEDELDAALGAATRVPLGTAGGEFFISGDEDAGATVVRNELTLELVEDGTGTFAGVLDINQVDGTVITLAMSGQILWSTSADPQVEATLTGTYVKDSPIDADDVQSTESQLSISSLLSGVGSLCAPTQTGNCFGFTFATADG
ncbi:MAG: hypothetical protein AAF567_13850 [Actinomycetota bacterium]